MLNEPYQILGQHLKHLREQFKETVAEVSGAVEINEKDLNNIEEGYERPVEEVLLLLISHFKISNQEAAQLWELAGYDSDLPEQLQYSDEPKINKNVLMLVAMDMRTIYTDSVEINTNRAGMTIGFNQELEKDKMMPVCRVGMSLEQAQQVIQQMQLAMLKVQYVRQPKALPSSSNNLKSSSINNKEE